MKDLFQSENQVKIWSENCKSLVLQNKCNIEIFLSPGLPFEVKEISWMLLGFRPVYFFHSEAGYHAMSDGQQLHTRTKIMRKKHNNDYRLLKIFCETGGQNYKYLFQIITE